MSHRPERLRTLPLREKGASMTSQKVAIVGEGANGAGTACPELDVTFTEQSPAHVEACERIAFGSLGGRAREKPIEIAAKIECVKLAARFRTPTLVVVGQSLRIALAQARQIGSREETGWQRSRTKSS